MFSAQKLPDHKTELNSFESIYRAAKEKDIHKVTAVLTQASIDVQAPIIGTPVTQLAYEGDLDSVKFLRDEFNASLTWIILGFAKGGHVKEAKATLALASNPTERFALLQFKMAGYAQGGYVDEANTVLSLASSRQEHSCMLKEMLCGFALSNNQHEIKKIERLASNKTEQLYFLQNKAAGYALGGHFEEVKKILEQSSSLNHQEQIAILQPLIYGYALGAYIDEVKKILGLNNLALDQEERLVLLRSLAYGYGRSGHHHENDSIFDLALNPDERFFMMEAMIAGYALGGHFQEVNKLFNALSPEERVRILPGMATAYGLGGHVDEADRLLNSNPTMRSSILESLIPSYTQAANIFDVIKLLDSISNQEERQALLALVAASLKWTGVFLYHESALFMLAVFKPDIQSALANELKESKDEVEVDMGALVKQASLLHPLITAPSPLTRPINFRFQVGSSWPQIQEWLLMTGLDLFKKKKLHSHTVITIASYLTPLTYKETLGLSERMFEKYRPHFFSRPYQEVQERSKRVIVQDDETDSADLRVKRERRTK